jgi:hypothetical protein
LLQVFHDHLPQATNNKVRIISNFFSEFKVHLSTTNDTGDKFFHCVDGGGKFATGVNHNDPDGILTGFGEIDSWKNLKSNISWHCPNKARPIG